MRGFSLAHHHPKTGGEPFGHCEEQSDEAILVERVAGTHGLRRLMGIWTQTLGSVLVESWAHLGVIG